MRIMDCVLLLFRRAISPVVFDPERSCVTPSWSESLKVISYLPNLLLPQFFVLNENWTSRRCVVFVFENVFETFWEYNSIQEVFDQEQRLIRPKFTIINVATFAALELLCKMFLFLQTWSEGKLLESLKETMSVHGKVIMSAYKPSGPSGRRLSPVSIAWSD